MAARGGSDNAYGADPPKLSFFQRIRYTIVKPDGPDPNDEQDDAMSLEEIEAAIKSSDDKERNVGLVAAPFAALIGFIIITTLIDHDPPQLLSNGQKNAAYVSLSLYHELLGVLVVLAVLILVMSWLRKRLLAGISMALFGLAVFNLHYWGFGIPFVMVGAWLLVHSYRLSQKLRFATMDGTGPTRPSGRTTRNPRPRSSKRYTPPS